MSSLKSKALFILSLCFAFFLTACHSSGAQPEDLGSKENPVLLGVVGEDQEVWDFVIQKLEKDDIHVELVHFSSYIPNEALAHGDIHLNAFQHQLFLDSFNEDKGANLQTIGKTIIASQGIYSQKVNSLEDIPDHGEIVIPDDPTNAGRALNLLQTAGLIKLDPSAGHLASIDDIKENPKHLSFHAVDNVQTVRSLEDVDAGVVVAGMAKDAGLSVTHDAIFREPVDASTQAYANVIAARPDETDLPIYQKIVQAYQAEDTAKVIEKAYQGGCLPAW